MKGRKSRAKGKASSGALAENFRSIVGDEYVLTGDADREFYGKDSLKQFHARPAFIVLPRSEAEIVEIVRTAYRKRIALVPSGGRTGYSGGATAQRGEVVVSLARMTTIQPVNQFDHTIVCQAGVTTETVQRVAREAGLLYPVDFASRGSSLIGGNVATNAGGVRVIRYGNTRDWVLGLRAVTGTGELLDLNGPLFKNQTGYDLRGLFVGSEGTLGIITEVTLKLTAAAPKTALALCAIKSAKHALTLFSALRRQGFVLQLFEYFEQDALSLVCDVHGVSAPFRTSHPCYLVVEVECVAEQEMVRFSEALGAAIDDGELLDVVVAHSSAQASQLLRFREGISEAINRRFVPHKNDISVPLGAIPEFLSRFRTFLTEQKFEVNAVVFGHIGDGNLHLNILKPQAMDSAKFFTRCDALDEGVFSIVRELRGSISAEHGVGLLKRDHLTFSRSRYEIELMKKMKRLFDPRGILNPGKIFGSPLRKNLKGH